MLNIDIKKKSNNNRLINQIKLDFEKNKFAILKINCSTCGLFSFYNHYLGCIFTTIKSGYIPIIDLTFPNIFNRDNLTLLINNPWELFFNQPYEYTLESVKKNAKYIKNIACYLNKKSSPNKYTIYKNKFLMDFWHNMANKYIPIKKEIIIESKSVMKNLFKNSNNILGVLVRGTDYITCKPKKHPVQPKIETMLKDIKEMFEKNNYDYIFISTEDQIIRKTFISKFKEKIKFIKPKKSIKYNYNKKLFLYYDKGNTFDYDYFKTYLLNILILSKCIDIICGRCNGSVAAFIFTDGFRYNKVYYLGDYK